MTLKEISKICVLVTDLARKITWKLMIKVNFKNNCKDEAKTNKINLPLQQSSKSHQRYHSKFNSHNTSNSKLPHNKHPSNWSRSHLPPSLSPINMKRFQQWRFKNIIRISTYTGCTIHEYRLPKDGKWKKCNGYAIHKSKFYKSKFLVQHIKSNKLMKCMAFGQTEKLIGIKAEDYQPSMLPDLKQNLINKSYFLLKLIQPLSRRGGYIIAKVKNH